MIRRMAIFCGSRTGNNHAYVKTAGEFASLLAANGVEMVYGGGRNGLMGVVADTMMEKGGKVSGVIPEVLIKWESQHQNISELLVVEDMHVRKRTIYEKCDAAAILPGGFGTLDELFEILTWNQLSIHDKKIFILNVDGFYNHLLAHMEMMAEQGFLYGNPEAQYTVLAEAADILPFITAPG